MIGRRWKTISFQESARSLVAISCRFWSSRRRGKSKNERSQPNRETEISDPDDSFAGPVSFLFDTHSSPRIRSCTPFTGLRWHAVPFFSPFRLVQRVPPSTTATIFTSFNFMLLWLLVRCDIHPIWEFLKLLMRFYVACTVSGTRWASLRVIDISDENKTENGV